MERRQFIAGAGVALAATAGCMGSDDSAEGSFSESVEFAWYGVAGDPFHVRVTAENTGEAEATYETALTADGSEVATGSATLAAQGQQTITLAHTFDDPGEYDLAAAGEETTLTVYETPLTLFQEADFDMGTRVSEEETTQSGEFVVDGQPLDFSSDRSATVRQNYQEETQYTEEEVTTQVGGETEEETVEEWVVDGTLYTRTTNHTDDEVTYETERSDEFEEGPDYSDSAVSQYISTAHTEEEYVFSIDPSSSEAATEVWAALDDSPGEEFAPERVTSLSLDARLDRQLMRPASVSLDITLEEFEGFSVLEMTIVEEITEYGVAVTVEVPEDVRDELSESSTTPT